MIRIKCAIYARYSSVMQRITSIEDQIAKCREYALSRGWEILEDHIYYDKEISGASTVPRDEFNKLMQIAESGSAPFTYIIVDCTSRVARNILDAFRTFARLKAKGIYVYYVSQGIDTSEKTAETLIAVNGMVDSLFLANLSDGTHRGLKGTFNRGYSTGGKRFGFSSKPEFTGKIDKHGEKEIAGYKLIIVPEESQAIVEIFKLHGEKEYSPQQIATKLNKRLKEKGSPKPPQGAVWSSATIWRILRNEVYRGLFVWNKKSSESNLETGGKKAKKNSSDKWITRHDPELQIIDDALWAKSQARREEAKSKTAGRFVKGRPIYSEHLLTKITKCKCGSTFGIVTGGKFAKYGCTKSWNSRSQACSNSVKIRKVELEEVIVFTLCKELLDKNALEKLYKDVEININDYVSKCLAVRNQGTISDELLNIEKQLRNMIADIREGNSSQMLRQEIVNLERTRNDLQNQLNLSKNVNSHSDVAQLVTYSDLEKHFTQIIEELLKPETTRKTLYEVVDGITVSNNGESSIDIEILEKNDITTNYLVNLISKRNSRIRLQTGSHLQPYTSRIFKARIVLTLEKDCISHEDNGINIFYT